VYVPESSSTTTRFQVRLEAIFFEAVIECSEIDTPLGIFPFPAVVCHVYIVVRDILMRQVKVGAGEPPTRSTLRFILES
jgi:hypothetical protein